MKALDEDILDAAVAKDVNCASKDAPTASNFRLLNEAEDGAYVCKRMSHILSYGQTQKILPGGSVLQVAQSTASKDKNFSGTGGQ